MLLFVHSDKGACLTPHTYMRELGTFDRRKGDWGGGSVFVSPHGELERCVRGSTVNWLLFSLF